MGKIYNSTVIVEDFNILLWIMGGTPRKKVNIEIGDFNHCKSMNLADI